MSVDPTDHMSKRNLYHRTQFSGTSLMLGTVQYFDSVRTPRFGFHEPSYNLGATLPRL